MFSKGKLCACLACLKLRLKINTVVYTQYYQILLLEVCKAILRAKLMNGPGFAFVTFLESLTMAVLV